MSTRPVSTAFGPGTDTAPKPSETNEPGDPPVTGAVARASVTRERIDVEIAAAKVSASDGVDVAVFSASIKTTAHQATLEGQMFIIGVEGTVGYTGSTVTGGLAVDAGAELSVGFRDLDKDGSQELCARVSAGFVTLGLCVENPL